MKPNKENIISDILLELEKGATFELLLTKFNLSRPTFSKYWKIANERHREVQISRQKEVATIGTDSAKEALKQALYDKDSHALDLLSQIKDLEVIKAGKSVKVGGTIISATHGDEIRAKGEIRQIKTLIGTWYGYEAPKKIDSKQTITLENISLEQAKELKSKLETDV